jgi:hypothetical protein
MTAIWAATLSCFFYVQQLQLRQHWPQLTANIHDIKRDIKQKPWANTRKQTQILNNYFKLQSINIPQNHY